MQQPSWHSQRSRVMLLLLQAVASAVASGRGRRAASSSSEPSPSSVGMGRDGTCRQQLRQKAAADCNARGCHLWIACRYVVRLLTGTTQKATRLGLQL
jgi:hypothetical protein